MSNSQPQPKALAYTGPERRSRERRQPRSVEVRPTWASVDEGALAHNLRTVQAHVGERCRVLAVVKADGYGHGAVESARAFVDAGAWGLAVSLVEEGVELRQHGVRAPVLVLSGVHPGSEDVIVHGALTPVVWSPQHFQLLTSAVRRSGAATLPVHIKIDTGMSRLGVLPEDLGALLDWYQAHAASELRIEGVMTHFACADDAEDALTSARQLERFQACLRVLGERRIHPSIRHVCNSAGLVRFSEAHLDMVRPGIALYGAGSSRAVELPELRMAMGVHSRLLGIRELPAGTAVSYGHRQVLDRPSRLGIVPVGYGDGYPRTMSGRAQMLIRGHRCPVVGNITMDLSMVDVTELPDAREGERVTLMGTQGRERIDLYELADWAQLIPYEVTCGLSKRVPRRPL
ncbi:alanine racemase [Plesiocystis pacifica SIR-1]|uniref:Alanine racemase n=1 Tax=Plesiocystis pacifica SIR-1 TaxID=391625 RepID=A6G197_9BACT|nr:alanine racemase [Plesiocystis pacifica]EDM80392.1 alanine racemase [Plesiocystis pacifica SIR-1]